MLTRGSSGRRRSWRRWRIELDGADHDEAIGETQVVHAVERVVAVFTTSGRRSRRPECDYRRLAYCLNEGLVEVKRFRYKIVDRPEPLDYHKWGIYQAARRDTGNREHHFLKWHAW